MEAAETLEEVSSISDQVFFFLLFVNTLCYCVY